MDEVGVLLGVWKVDMAEDTESFNCPIIELGRAVPMLDLIQEEFRVILVASGNSETASV